MSNYRELHTLPNPVDPKLLVKWLAKKSLYIQSIPDCSSLLSQELLSRFDKIGITPECCYLFGLMECQERNTWIHTDLVSRDNQFIKFPCAINWELTPGNATFNWWEIEGPEVYPNPSVHGQVDGYHLLGIHYETASINDDPLNKYDRDTIGSKTLDNGKIIESLELKFNTPYLVKVDVPHSVVYSTQSRQRIGLSVRFTAQQIPTWERALEVFDLFINK